jgi:hypothetical protein
LKKAFAAAAGALALAVTTLVSTPLADPPAKAGARPGAPIGFVDRPVELAVVGPRVEMNGWAFSPGGTRAVEVRWEGGKATARIGIARADVAAARPDVGGNTGWEFVHDFGSDPPPPGWDRRRLEVVAVGADGRETVLARRDLIQAEAFTRWRGESRATQAFYILPATSGLDVDGAREIDTDYRAYVSGTVKVGVRVPVLYLRTTLGKGGDYAFDPDWDVNRKCARGRIADDSLNTVLGHSAAKRLPVLITLNGGLWADAGCDVPEWDLNDRLEADPANCQWNNANEVRPDDALRNLPGSQNSPELARSLTFNVYASEVRRLKKRNLQQAARLVAAFDRRHPGLLVGVSLDPDVYINPWFEQREWYDFNPGTIRQFRHWLAGTGPYAGRPDAPGVPDLRSYARARPLTLAEVNKVARREFRSWDEVDPPRVFAREGPTRYWTDPWFNEWDVFRRHLVNLHYSELAEWAVEAGLDADRIWTGQGFTPSGEGTMPLATRIASAARSFDSAGVSVEGAKPAKGHLGAVIYGYSATNEVILEEGKSLFATFASYDRGWGSVEFNVTSLNKPRVVPPAHRGYRGLRELWNHQARFVSPMAWNGWHGVSIDHPEYLPYTSWRGTPAEEAAKDFMLARAGLPRGALLWTFGTPQHADRDDWTTALGATIAQRSSLRLEPGTGGRVVIDSPRELAVVGESRLVVLTASGALDTEVWARAQNDPPWAWRRLVRGDATQGLALPRIAGDIDQLRLALSLPNGSATVTRIAVLPGKR